MLTYAETLAYMYRQLPMYQRQGAPAMKKTLDNIIALCAELGDPQRKFRAIHVGGTNGKGTVSHMIAAALQAHGMRVGMYTSPHYIDFRERIKINGQFMGEQAVVDFVAQHRAIIEEIQPSFFEITVAMAFDYFAQQEVDIAVIEVGLGGRLDSTNIIQPLFSVITNISLDHQAMLGNTVEEIAGEKAGIIKLQTPVVIGEYQRAVADVFTQKAQLLAAPLTFASREVELAEDHGWRVSVGGDVWMRRLRTDLVGPYQLHNLKTALMALHALRKTLNLQVSKIKKGLKAVSQSTYYVGRWQQLGTRPDVLADSAHNEGGLSIVLGSLARTDYERRHFVLGFVSDKEVGKVLRMFPADADYYWAKADIPRGMPVAELAAHGAEAGLVGEAYGSVAEAFQAAKQKAGKGDLVYVGGSIFVVAEVLGE